MAFSAREAGCRMGQEAWQSGHDTNPHMVQPVTPPGPLSPKTRGAGGLGGGGGVAYKDRARSPPRDLMTTQTHPSHRQQKEEKKRANVEKVPCATQKLKYQQIRGSQHTGLLATTWDLMGALVPVSSPNDDPKPPPGATKEFGKGSHCSTSNLPRAMNLPADDFAILESLHWLGAPYRKKSGMGPESKSTLC